MISYVSIDVLMALIIYIVVFWVVISRSLRIGYPSFGEACCLNLQGVNVCGEETVGLHRQVKERGHSDILQVPVTGKFLITGAKK